ncbi:MAG: hypothetical protein R3F05_00315 [Planctomycetota bacterium]
MHGRVRYRPTVPIYDATAMRRVVFGMGDRRTEARHEGRRTLHQAQEQPREQDGYEVQARPHPEIVAAEPRPR